MKKLSNKNAYHLANYVKNYVEKNYSVPQKAKYGDTVLNAKEMAYTFAYVINHLTEDVAIPSIATNNQRSKPISRQIYKKDYIILAQRVVNYIKRNGKISTCLVFGDYEIGLPVYIYAFARILVYYDNHKQLPAYVNVNSKAFVKPHEASREVYDYFVETFGSFGDTIDGALTKIAGNGYGYYYDDKYTNKQSINRMKNGDGVNCTDSCHVFYNILLHLIGKGKYRKVECLHVLCSGGDGHVRLRITLNDGTYIYRDPAAVLSSGNIAYNWCLDGEILAVNPDWFMANLSR